jgi:hypothetical protein
MNFPAALLLATVAIATSSPEPVVCAPETGPCTSAIAEWMPDVARRRAELAGRFEDYAAESRGAERNRSQWWRASAARPKSGEQR